MSESDRPARFVCYPNGDVEDRERGAVPGGGQTDQQPAGRSSVRTSAGRTAAGGTVGLLILITLLRVFQTISDREPDHDDPTAPYRNRVGNMPPNPHATRQAEDTLRALAERQQPRPRVDPITAAVVILDQTQKLLTNVSLVLDRAGNAPRLSPTAERSLEQADAALDRVEDVLCRCVADGPPPLASPTVDSLLQRLAELRGQTASLRLRVRPAAGPVLRGPPVPDR